MYFEPETNSIVFKQVDPQDALSASRMLKTQEDETTYEN